MKEEMRTIGYLCPACHKRVIQQRSVFALSASGAVVSCECGESSLTIEAEENKFRLSVPCGVCGEEHLAECSADKLLHGRGIGLACPDTKMLCCFIGEDYAVEHEMEQLSLAAAKEREQGDDPAAFADSVIMYEILSELKESRRTDGIDAVSALVHFLDYCGASGVVCTEVSALESGYLLHSTSTSSLRLAPVWRITTDVNNYYVNCKTGEITRE